MCCAARTATRGGSGDDRLVADVLVDDVGGLPELLQIDTGVETDAGERLRERLGRHAVHRQRDGVHRGRDHVRARARCFERRGERVATCALRVETDRKPGKLAQLAHQLSGAVRLQHGGGVVEQDPRGAHLRQALRRVDERLVTAASVEQPRLELLPRADDRLGCLTQVVDVVQGIVEPEDVDAALRPRSRRNAAQSRRRPGASRPGTGRVARAPGASTFAP